MSGFNAVLGRNTENAPRGLGNASQTVAFSHYNHFSAQLPIDAKSGKLVAGGVKEQALQCFKNIEEVAKSINHTMSDVVRITIFVKSIKDVEAVEQVYKTFFPTYQPTKSVCAVSELPMNALVQVDAVISNGVGTIPNAPQAGDLIKLTSNTDKAPIDPLSSQLVAFSHYSNLTAQLPIDPDAQRIIAMDIKEQTAQCLKNVKSILSSIDVPLDDIVKVTIFLTNISDLPEVNQVYKTFFPDSSIARTVGYFPALTTVEVAELPMGALISIEIVASHGDGTPPQLIEDRHGLVIRANNTDKAPINPLAKQTVIFSHYNNIGAQLPIDVATGKLVSGGIKEQTEQCFKHIKTIVESVKHVIEDVVKVNIYVKNIADVEVVQQVYKTFFPTTIPAVRIVGTANLPMNALVQIDAVVANAEGTPPTL